MAQDLATIEPIPLPDLRRLGKTPSWPAWLAFSIDAVRPEIQNIAGQFREVLVAPTDRMLTEGQRQAVEAHRDSLHSCLMQTPENDPDAETRTATAVTKLLLVLPSARRSDTGEEARSEVYMEVLDDVPCWAVENAVRRWHRHDCGTDERGRPHDYKWAPDPGTLRRIALSATWEIRGRLGVLERVLEARAYVDCSAELERGAAAMRGLFKCMGDSAALSELTFERAVAIGKATTAEVES